MIFFSNIEGAKLLTQALSIFLSGLESGDRGPGVDVSLIVHEHVDIISATFMNFFYSITEFRIKSRSFNIKE